jgi:hypothetical protein
VAERLSQKPQQGTDEDVSDFHQTHANKNRKRSKTSIIDQNQSGEPQGEDIWKAERLAMNLHDDTSRIVDESQVVEIQSQDGLGTRTLTLNFKRQRKTKR